MALLQQQTRKNDATIHLTADYSGFMVPRVRLRVLSFRFLVPEH